MNWVRQIFSRRRAYHDLSEEIREHLEERTEELVAGGMARADAAAAARREFGNVALIQEDSRAVWQWPAIENFAMDLRYGLRAMRRNSGFSAVAVLTLALGIGANTAIFTLLDAVIFRTLPAADPQQLVLLQWHAHKTPSYAGTSSFGDCASGGSGGDNPWGCSFSSPMFDAIRAQTTAFDGLAAFAGPAVLTVTGNGAPSWARGEIISGDYFQTLGIRAALGRTLEPTDDVAGAPPVVVLSYGYWQSALGGAASAIGRSIELNRVSFTIVGVAEAGFANLTPGKNPGVYLTRAMFPRVGTHVDWSRIQSAGNAWLVILARLKPGVSRERAQSAVSVTFRNELSHGAKPLLDPKYGASIQLLSARDGLSEGVKIKQPLYVLMLAVGIILLIACANVAGLLLARSTTRQREMAVRLALGAPRGRLARQLLTESVLLSVFGGVAGVFLAYWGVHAIAALLSGGSSKLFPFAIAPDARILFFTLGISILSGSLVGLTPALCGTRLDLTPALKESTTDHPHHGRGAANRWFGAGNALVAAQVALTMIVLAGAGLLVRTLNNLQDVNPGFDTKNVLLFGVDPALLGYPAEKIQGLYGQMQAELAALPGVISTSYSSDSLLSGDLSTRTMSIEGQPEDTDIELDTLATGPGFFETLRIPLLTGRTFNASDIAHGAAPASPLLPDGSAPQSSDVATAVSSGFPTQAPSDKTLAPVQTIEPVVVNEAFVRHYCRKRGPLGMHLIQGDSSSSHGDTTEGKSKSRIWEVVGVVADAKYDTMRREIHPTVYRPLHGGGAHFELRTAADPAPLIPAVRGIVAHLDSDLPLSDVSTQRQEIYQQLSQERFIARLSSFFGALALLLACIGVYGLLSYNVARRTREIGIRMALGAERRNVLRMVLGQGITVAAVGAIMGAGASWAVARYLQNLLYGVRPGDPVTLIAVTALLLLVVLAACYVPARRATRVDPLVALRHE
jgi:predicted permease